MIEELYKKVEAQPTTAYTNNGDNLYNRLKSEAAQNRSMAESNLKKRMSDLGQTNQSLTVENNAKMAGTNDLGSISQQQQDYINQQNYLQKQANLQTQAQNAELAANNYSAQLNALMNDENSRFGIYYNLLNNKKITRAQFKNLTGIDVKDIPSGSGSSSSSGNDINSFINSNTSNTNGIGIAKVDTSPSANDTTLSIGYKNLYNKNNTSNQPYKITPKVTLSQLREIIKTNAGR